MSDLIDRAALLRRWENLQAIIATSNVRSARAMDVIRLIDAAPRAATEPTLDTADFNEGLRLHAQSPGHHYSLDDCRAALGEPPLTRERLAAALHERYAAALCLDPEGPHTWPCAAFSQWMDDAASILEALATPTSEPLPSKENLL